MAERSTIERVGAIAVAVTSVLTLLFLLFPTLKPDGTQSSSSPPPSSASSFAPSPTQPAARALVAQEPAAPVPAAPAAPQPSQGDVILGTWQQFGLVPQTAQWVYLATFVVAKADGVYTMSAREQRENPQVINSIGIFDVQSDGTRWSFNSNWGRGVVGNFMLHRVSNTTFEGIVSVDGRPVDTSRWIKVQ